PPVVRRGSERRLADRLPRALRLVPPARALQRGAVTLPAQREGAHRDLVLGARPRRGRRQQQGVAHAPAPSPPAWTPSSSSSTSVGTDTARRSVAPRESRV